MPARQILPGCFAVGAIDWDREIFDALIPLPNGTSYNAYIVRGSEKVALIDTVDPTKTSELWRTWTDSGSRRSITSSSTTPSRITRDPFRCCSNATRVRRW